jgi:hypothetical protein
MCERRWMRYDVAGYVLRSRHVDLEGVGGAVRPARHLSRDDAGGPSYPCDLISGR